MKRTLTNILLALVAAFIFSVMTAMPAHAQTRTASVSGNWSDTATWGGAAVPTSADDVTINSGIAVTVDTSAAANTVTFALAAASNSMTISGTNSLTVTGLITMPRPATGQTTTIAVGAGTLSAGSVTMNATITARNDIISVSTGTVTISGTITTGTTGCQFTFTGAGTMNIGGNFTSTPALTAFTGSTVNYNGGAQPVLGDTYFNLTVSGSGTKTLGNNLVVSNNFTVGNGTALTVGANSIAITGNTTLNGQLNLDGTLAKTFGDVVVNSGGTWNQSTNDAVTISGSLQNDGTLTAGTSAYTFSGTGKAFSGTNAIAIPRVTITGAGASTYTNNGVLTVSTVLAGADTLINGATGTLNIGGTATITALTATAAGNTVNYNGAAQTAKVTTYHNLTLSGSGAKTFATTPTVNGLLSLEGTATVVVTTGVVTYGGSATLQYNTATARTASSEEWITPFAATGGVIIAGTGNVTLNADKVFNASVPLTINSGAKLNASSFQLTLPGTFTATGTFNADTGTVIYTGASQTIAPITYRSLTINQSSGNTTLSGNATVNGVLTLTAGNLNVTDPNILTMGASATTVGAKDVTGIVKRTTLVAATTYSFGNQYTTVTFQNTGTLPTDLSVKISVGSAPAWKTDAIKRHYEVVRTGGSGSVATLVLHYLDAELNSNNETGLVKWASESPSTPGSGAELGKSNQDTTNNWVETANWDVSIWKTSFGLRDLSLADTVMARNTWHGQVSTDWTNVGNWSTGWAPLATENVTIPDAATTNNDPTLPAGTTVINTLTLQSGAILNSGATSNLSISGGSGAWMNTGGTFVPSAGTVSFNGSAATISGTTSFNNLAINSGADVTNETDSIVRIGGAITNSGTWRAAMLHSSVEYYGGSQTVLNPNGLTPGYHILILSGSGVKTMPGTALSIADNFAMSGTASATALAAMNFAGSFTVGSGTSFTTGALTHQIGGDFSNSGAFTAIGSTIILNGSSAQAMSGAITFNNLTLNNAGGLTINNNETVVSTLTLTSGNITTGSNTVIISPTGTVARTSGWVYGNLQKYVTTGATSITFETGENDDYNPVTVAFGNVTVAGNLTARLTDTQHPDIASSTINPSKNVTHYWTLTNSGISFSTYSATFTFSAGDIGGSANTSSFIVGKYDSGWTYPAVGTRTSTSTQATGLTSFSDFAMGELAITWLSYNSAALTIADDNFTAGENTVYMFGNNFLVSHSYTVGYYDGTIADGGLKVASDSGLISGTSGNLSSQYLLTTDFNSAAGTWHAVVFDSDLGDPADNYTAALDSPALVTNHSFEVTQAAIPEFPSVIAAIMVSGSCFGLYYWMRRKKQASVRIRADRS